MMCALEALAVCQAATNRLWPYGVRVSVGAYRLAGSPREYSCPSDAEEHAALYNMACCYAQLGQKAASLTCLESILESGIVDALC